ncbi:hypothetical protein ABT381_21050, partial [Streptomyces sp. NPDC000151]
MGETTPAPGPAPVVLGVDSGGSGLRIAVARAYGDAAHGDEAAAGGAPAPVRRLRTVVFREPVRTGPDGIDADDLLGRLLPAADSLLREAGGGGRCAAVCVGAAGMAALGDG